MKSGSSGSGGGVVVLNVAANTGGPRSGTATIAGQTFTVNQGGGACGALDVTSKVRPYKSGITWIGPFSWEYVRDGSAVTNTSGAVVPGTGLFRDCGDAEQRAITLHYLLVPPQG